MTIKARQKASERERERRRGDEEERREEEGDNNLPARGSRIGRVEQTVDAAIWEAEVDRNWRGFFGGLLWSGGRVEVEGGGL